MLTMGKAWQGFSVDAITLQVSAQSRCDAAMVGRAKEAVMDNGFGSALKEWRAAKRRISQLQLSLAANVSARHIAFLETGRARPSRSMVMHLGEALDVPSAERNRMLGLGRIPPGLERPRAGRSRHGTGAAAPSPASSSGTTPTPPL